LREPYFQNQLFVKTLAGHFERARDPENVTRHYVLSSTAKRGILYRRNGN